MKEKQIDNDISREKSTTHTDRGIERREEDSDFVPVIVKRNDEALRHPDDILEKAIEEGVEQQNRAFFPFFSPPWPPALFLALRLCP
jgi:hypothetical protein